MSFSSSCFAGVVVAVVGRWVKVGWEGERADGSERYSKNPRSKLMRFHPSFLLHRFFVSSLFMFLHPDEDVDSRSWRVCALSQLCTQNTDRTGKGVCV